MEKTLVWDLPEGDKLLKSLLDFNPVLYSYNKRTFHITGRDPSSTDRGGWRGYNRVYSKYISHFKDEPIKLMEVGVNVGYGLLAWARYYRNATIFGMENDISYSRFHNKMLKNYEEYERVKIFYGDSTDSYSWLEIDEKFDVIIDDGNHHPESQIKTLRRAWPYLKKDGFYFIEDISYRYSIEALKFLEAEIGLLESQGNKVKSYYHKNEGWQKILDNPKVWKNYGVTERTPNKAIDFITVIQKLR